jgi:hypothetical protein
MLSGRRETSSGLKTAESDAVEKTPSTDVLIESMPGSAFIVNQVHG